MKIKLHKSHQLFFQKFIEDYNINSYVCKQCKHGQETISLIHIDLQQKSLIIFTKIQKGLQQKFICLQKNAKWSSNNLFAID
jgi:ribosomal protein L40E